MLATHPKPPNERKGKGDGASASHLLLPLVLLPFTYFHYKSLYHLRFNGSRTFDGRALRLEIADDAEGQADDLAREVEAARHVREAHVT